MIEWHLEYWKSSIDKINQLANRTVFFSGYWTNEIFHKVYFMLITMEKNWITGDDFFNLTIF